MRQREKCAVVIYMIRTVELVTLHHLLGRINNGTHKRRLRRACQHAMAAHNTSTGGTDALVQLDENFHSCYRDKLTCLT